MKTLSDKIKDKRFIPNSRTKWTDGISVINVKEFIKDLKKEIGERGITNEMNFIIDKLAGDRLI